MAQAVSESLLLAAESGHSVTYRSPKYRPHPPRFHADRSARSAWLEARAVVVINQQPAPFLCLFSFVFVMPNGSNARPCAHAQPSRLCGRPRNRPQRHADSNARPLFPVRSRESPRLHRKKSLADGRRRPLRTGRCRLPRPSLTLHLTGPWFILAIGGV